MGSGQSRKVRVWDLPTRLFHWLLVLSLAGSWWTAETEQLERHLLFGYAVIGLLIFRILWGFVGSQTARFAEFLRGPRAVRDHLRDLVTPGPQAHHAGHNPLGGWAVLVLLLVIGVQAGTGLFLSGGDIFLVEAPLNGYVASATANALEEVHEVNFDLLLILVGVHVAAILLYRVLKGHRLLPAMITGRMALPPGEPAPRLAPLWRAAATALAAGLVAWGIASLG